MAASELTRRVAVAGIGVPVAVAIIYMGGWVLGVVLAVIAALGALEIYGLAAQRGARAFPVSGAGLAAAFVLATTADPAGAGNWLWVLTVGVTLGISALAIWQRGVAGAPLESIAVTIFGAVFVGGSLAHAMMLRQLAGASTTGPGWTGAALLAFPITCAWIGDTCAYFAGRAWGRRKLIPRISPGKTVEGAIAAVIGTVFTGAVYAWAVFETWQGIPIGPFSGALAGLLISPVAQVGDLAESLFKREAGVKDSGRLFPGHGGVLDRFDSLFFAIPVAYWFLAVCLPLWVEGLPW